MSWIWDNISLFWAMLYCFFKDRGVDPFKDIFVPFLALDKMLALAGLIYAIRTFNNSYKLNKVNFIHQLTQSHRDIWSKIHQAKLERVLELDADPDIISPEERRHIIFLILNVKVSYEAHKSNIYHISKQAKLDIGNTMNKPLFNKVWETLKSYYEADFILFVEECKKKAKDGPKKSIYDTIRDIHFDVRVRHLISSITDWAKTFWRRKFY